jgi:hypothetical protein
MGSQRNLFDIVLALGPDSFVFGLGQGRQEHRCENRNDSDNHKQFNQGESSICN